MTKRAFYDLYVRMAYNDAQKKAHYKYAQKNLKRIPLDVQLSEFDIIRQHADAAGEPINTYIKTAIRSRIASDDRRQETRDKRQETKKK